MMRTDSKATIINNKDYSCYITAIELDYMESISLHITPLFINSLGGGHTHTNTHTHYHTHTHTDVHTEKNSRNQVQSNYKYLEYNFEIFNSIHL